MPVGLAALVAVALAVWLAGCQAPAPAPVIEAGAPAGALNAAAAIAAEARADGEAVKAAKATADATDAPDASEAPDASDTPASAGARPVPAPAAKQPERPAKRARRYVVRAGDTLYSIAWRHGANYRALSAANRIPPPYTIQPGQTLVIVDNESRARPSPAPPVSSRRWQWPLARRAAAPSRQPDHRGLRFGAAVGTPVRAARGGAIVYAGDGLPGYGNLIIIKHDRDWTSAYGYNQRLLAKEGQAVSGGQIIALSGRDADGRPALYFEIRRHGKQVNATQLLPKL